jgi:hypothetical protein
MVGSSQGISDSEVVLIARTELGLAARFYSESALAVVLDFIHQVVYADEVILSTWRPPPRVACGPNTRHWKLLRAFPADVLEVLR